MYSNCTAATCTYTHSCSRVDLALTYVVRLLACIVQCPACLSAGDIQVNKGTVIQRDCYITRTLHTNRRVVLTYAERKVEKNQLRQLASTFTSYEVDTTTKDGQVRTHF